MQLSKRALQSSQLVPRLVMADRSEGRAMAMPARAVIMSVILILAVEERRR